MGVCKYWWPWVKWVRDGCLCLDPSPHPLPYPQPPTSVLCFLGGLSLHLNHLIASRMANYDWPFGTLPFGLFGSNLDTRDLETYPRTYSGHFLKYVNF